MQVYTYGCAYMWNSIYMEVHVKLDMDVYMCGTLYMEIHVKLDVDVYICGGPCEARYGGLYMCNSIHMDACICGSLYTWSSM